MTYSDEELAPTVKQLRYIASLARKRGLPTPEPYDRVEASEDIQFLKGIDPGYQCSHGKRGCRPCEKITA